MLHELLLALSGHIGGLFIERDGRIKVMSVSFLHPGEESLLNQICEHGTYYLQFQRFRERFINFRPHLDIAPGLYMNSLCYTLQDDILSEYEECLVMLEEEIMMDSQIPLTYIHSQLQSYTLLFPTLSQLLHDIEKKKVRGCQLLSLINKYKTSGIPEVKVAMNKLMCSLHKVMYKQLSSWLLRGSLNDPYNEFYIHKTATNKALMSNTTENNQDGELGIGGLSGEQLRQLHKSQELSVSKKADGTMSAAAAESNEVFSLRVEMLPSYLPTRVLHKLLFIGESVDTFENSNKMDAKKSILRHKGAEFARMLHVLSQSDSFHVLEFEKVVDNIRTEVSERLWDYVVLDSELYSVLRNVKSLYLLGRGDLYQELMVSADVLLSSPPNHVTVHDANRIFQQVLRSLNMSDEKLLHSFRLSLESSAAKGSKQSGWTLLSLDYQADWPLHVFFTPAALERYNIIFKFLLSVKRVHVALHQAWKQLMTRWFVTNQSEPEDQGQGLLYQLRNHMQFLVDNLQTYLQVDVIESQFNEMLETIKKSKDFEVIRTTHEKFQTSLLAQCFLLNVPVNHCLTCILESCSSFCSLLDACDGAMTPDQLDHCQAVQSMFQKQTLLLFKILTNTKTHQRNPHLVQLLLRIDYNKYFTDAGNQLGG